MSNKDLIVEAIEKKKTISFYYKEGERIVEPFLLGYLSTTDNLTLRAYFIDGYSKSGKFNSWKLYTVSEMEDIRIMDSSFSGLREYYNPEDKAMSTIISKI